MTDEIPDAIRGTYEQWLELLRSGQMSEQDFQERMHEDEVFRAWVTKRLRDEER